MASDIKGRTQSKDVAVNMWPEDGLLNRSLQKTVL
jgi:hypothetical protein